VDKKINSTPFAYKKGFNWTGKASRSREKKIAS
jgi:hypothetical protein